MQALSHWCIYTSCFVDSLGTSLIESTWSGRPFQSRWWLSLLHMLMPLGLTIPSFWNPFWTLVFHLWEHICYFFLPPLFFAFIHFFVIRYESKITVYSHISVRFILIISVFICFSLGLNDHSMYTDSHWLVLRTWFSCRHSDILHLSTAHIFIISLLKCVLCSAGSFECTYGISAVFPFLLYICSYVYFFIPMSALMDQHVNTTVFSM